MLAPRIHLHRTLTLTTLAVALGFTAGCATGPRVIQDFPPPAAQIPGVEVRFDWHVEDSAGERFTGYEIQVSDDPDFQSVEVGKVVPAPPVTLDLAAKRWFWRVRGRYPAVGDRIRETPWSDVHFVGGRYVRRLRAFHSGVQGSVVDGPEAPTAPSGGSGGSASLAYSSSTRCNS